MKQFEQIRQWASERELLQKDNSFKQLAKLMEESGELADSLIKNKPTEFKDAIGDCVVVLTILAAQNGLNIEDCIEAAYDEIKDRKGEIKDGLFVKEQIKDCETCKYEHEDINNEHCYDCLYDNDFNSCTNWQPK